MQFNAQYQPIVLKFTHAIFYQILQLVAVFSKNK
jgi:hypothetical protein